MSYRGRPPKPIEQKRLAGNPGKRPLPNGTLALLPSTYEAVEPHRPLGAPGLELWNKVWEMGSTWISPTSDAEILLITCELIDERWNLRATVMREGRPEDRKALRDLDRQLINNLSLLGFSPTDRSRLGVAEVKARSKLEELRQRAENPN